jgi:hypothetical protein
MQLTLEPASKQSNSKAKKSPQSVRAEIQTCWGVGGDRCNFIAGQAICMLYYSHTSYMEHE